MWRCTSLIVVALSGSLPAAEPGLVGHWPLQGDGSDHSGHGNHAVNHGVDLGRGAFDGRSAWLEVPPGSSLRVGRGDCTVAASVCIDQPLTDVVGDIITLFDPASRRGFSLTIPAGSSGYSKLQADVASRTLALRAMSRAACLLRHAGNRGHS